jgi:hypothetical protein
MNHLLKLFQRISPSISWLLLVCLSLAIYGCGPHGDIYSIWPELCTRQIALVGEKVARYDTGSSKVSLTDYSRTSGSIYYYGLENGKIKLGRPASHWRHYIDLKDPDNDKFVNEEDGSQRETGGPLAPSPNEIGENGEVYIWKGEFYIVVYSASPEKLEYALTRSLDAVWGWKPEYCPEG